MMMMSDFEGLFTKTPQRERERRAFPGKSEQTFQVRWIDDEMVWYGHYGKQQEQNGTAESIHVRSGKEDPKART